MGPIRSHRDHGWQSSANNVIDTQFPKVIIHGVPKYLPPQPAVRFTGYGVHLLEGGDGDSRLLVAPTDCALCERGGCR